MNGDYFYSALRKRAPAARSAQVSGPPAFRGARATGRISKLFIGQSHGYIRLSNEREVFFHRGDVREGTAFNDLNVGDTVAFELFEDAVSGARALHVGRHNRPR